MPLFDDELNRLGQSREGHKAHHAIANVQGAAELASFLERLETEVHERRDGILDLLPKAPRKV